MSYKNFISKISRLLCFLSAFILASSCCDDCIKSNPCFPEEPSDKFGICLSQESIRCPTDFTDCYINLGEFYHIWRPLLEPTIDAPATYETFIAHDILVSGIFVDPDGGGDGGLPACGLPPLPSGPGTHNNYFKDPQMLFASIGSIESGNKQVALPNQEMLMFNYEQAHEKLAITITKFTNSILGIEMSYDEILGYYLDQIDLEEDLDPKPDLVEENFDVIGPSGITIPYFYFDHQSEIRTFIVKLNDKSILRIRCYSEKISDIEDFIEFYE